jgi:methylated-DNA-[protein]-cysteine S-methyltransferase
MTPSGSRLTFWARFFTCLLSLEVGEGKLIEIYSQTVEGITFAAAFNNGEVLTTTFRVDQKAALSTILDNLPFRLPFQVFHEPTLQARKALDVLKTIYAGKDTPTNLPLATSHLPSYTQKVLKVTQAVPAGYVTTYGAIAAAVGGGPRAVGNAMACNLFAPIVPCHRVVKSDLTLGGYGIGGLQVKYAFLDRERRSYSLPKTVEVCGGQLCLLPVEQVLVKLAR